MMCIRRCHGCLATLLAAALLLVISSIRPGLASSIRTSNPADSSADAAETRNAMTCLSSDSTREDNNCIQVIQAKFNRPYQKIFNNSLEFRLVYSYTNPKQTFAVSVESSDVVSDRPILFVVRQQKTVTSWELPFEGRYNSFRRTLCPQWINTTWVPVSLSNLVVDVSTSSSTDISFKFTVSVESEFNVQLDGERRTRVTPSENRYFQFAFPPSVNQVVVKSKSPDDVCMIVSIQSPTCPVFDTIYNVDYEGFRQSMTGQSYMIVQKEHFPDGFFLVFIVNEDDQRCLSEPSLAPFRPNRTKEVFFEIRKTVSIDEFQKVLFVGTIGLYGGFIILVIATCLVVEHQRRSKKARQVWEGTLPSYQTEDSPHRQLNSQISELTDVTRLDLEDQDRSGHSSHDSTSTSQEVDDVFIQETTPSSSSLQANSTNTSKRWRRVSEMARHQPDFYNKKSKRFISELCIIAVFYLIPVGQLVWNHKEMMITTGDQDMCYYNFACAYPYHLIKDFTDFNHFFSNIGYIVLGIIFLCITKRRDYIHQQMIRKQNAREHGIPPHYGLSYSMGFGLIVEGILSACYHVCPTRHNYQFDTAFMYVIAALCTLKLYHARHADVNVKSYMAYIFLALIVLLGAGTPIHDEFYFKIAFTVFHLAGCLILAVDIYYMGHCDWKLNKERMVEHVSTCWNSRPLYLERLALVVVGYVCNVVFAVNQLVLDIVDFNTHILAVLMINQFVYSIFYVVMKMRKREQFITSRIYPFLYLLAALAFWLTGSYFFLKKAAKWERSPAESRMLNQECFVLQVYDSHDLWHFLSSTALFFFFMFLLTLDDDIEFKPRRDIPVF